MMSSAVGLGIGLGELQSTDVMENPTATAYPLLHFPLLALRSKVRMREVVTTAQLQMVQKVSRYFFLFLCSVRKRRDGAKQIGVPQQAHPTGKKGPSLAGQRFVDGSSLCQVDRPPCSLRSYLWPWSIESHHRPLDGNARDPVECYPLVNQHSH